MSKFTSNFNKGEVEMLAPRASKVDISLKQGLINFTDYSQFTKLTSSEANSQICVQGVKLQGTVAGTNCIASSVQAKVLPIPSTAIDPDQLCTISSNVCNGTTCPAPDNSTVNLKVIDGQIQYQLKSVSLPSNDTFSLLRDHVEFNWKSRLILQEIQAQVKNSESRDELYIFDVFMAGYKGVWLYSTKRAYIIAKPWLLSVISMHIIKPKVIRHQLFLSHQACPINQVNREDMNKLISKEIKSILQPTNEKQIGLIVQRKRGGKYYVYEDKYDDAISDREIAFTDGRGIMLVTLILSVIISISTSTGAMYILFKLLKSNILDSSISQLRAQTSSKNHNTLAQEYLDHMENNVIQKGLITEKFKPIQMTEKRKQKLYQNSAIMRIDHFEGVSALLEYLQRKHTNSLLSMIRHNIPQSHTHFPNHDKQDLTPQTYIQLSDFRKIYKEYCLKFGFYPMDIEEHISSLENLGIFIESVQSPETQAYLKIRWRMEDEVAKLKRDPNKSTITNFIRTECVITSLDQDYILVAELQEKYEQYIRHHFGYDAVFEPIAGSSELLTMGLKLENVEIIVMRNITWVNPDSIEHSDKDTFSEKRLFQTNLARVPDREFRKWYDPEKYEKLVQVYRWAKQKSITRTGIVVNFFHVCVHLLYTAIIVMPINYLLSWSILEETQFDSDPFNHGYDERNILEPDYDNFWFSKLNIKLKVTIFVVLGINGLFVILSLIKMFQYYCSKMNTLNYRTKRTCPNKVIHYPFQIILIILLWIYLSYTSLFLIWWMLGAIINPIRFLPYATSSLSFISYVLYKYNNLQSFYKDVKKEITKEITKKMVKMQKEIISTIFDNESSLTSDDETDTLESLVKKQGREIIIYTFCTACGKDIHELPKELKKQLLEGDLDAYVQLISKVLGIHPMISYAILGVLKKDQDLVITSAKEFSAKFDISEDLCTTITQICLEEYTPRHFGIDETPKSTILKIKPLLRIFLRDINQDFLEGIIGIVLEKNCQRFVDYLENVNKNKDSSGEETHLAPINLFFLLLSIQKKTSINHKAVKAICKEVLEDSQKLQQLMLGLVDINLGKFNKFLDDKEKDEHIKMYVTPYMKNSKSDLNQNQSSSTRQDGHQQIKECVSDMFNGEEDKEEEVKGEEVKDNGDSGDRVQKFMKLFNQVNGNQTDIQDFSDYSLEQVKKSFHKFRFKNLKAAVDGNQEEFLKLVLHMNMENCYDLMNELFMLVNKNPTDIIHMNHTVNAFRLPTYYSKFLHQLIHFYSYREKSNQKNFTYDKTTLLAQEFGTYRSYCQQYFLHKKLRCKSKDWNLDPSKSIDTRKVMYQLQYQLSKSMLDQIMSLSIILKGIQYCRQYPTNDISRISKDYNRAITLISYTYNIQITDIQFIIDVLTRLPQQVTRIGIESTKKNDQVDNQHRLIFLTTKFLQQDNQKQEEILDWHEQHQINQDQTDKKAPLKIEQVVEYIAALYKIKNQSDLQYFNSKISAMHQLGVQELLSDDQLNTLQISLFPVLQIKYLIENIIEPKQDIVKRSTQADDQKKTKSMNDLMKKSTKYSKNLKKMKQDQLSIIIMLNHLTLLAQRFISTSLDRTESNEIRSQLNLLSSSNAKQKIHQNLLNFNDFSSSLYETGLFNGISKSLLKIPNEKMTKYPKTPKPQNPKTPINK